MNKPIQFTILLFVFSITHLAAQGTAHVRTFGDWSVQTVVDQMSDDTVARASVTYTHGRAPNDDFRLRVSCATDEVSIWSSGFMRFLSESQGVSRASNTLLSDSTTPLPADSTLVRTRFDKQPPSSATYWTVTDAFGAHVPIVSARDFRSRMRRSMQLTVEVKVVIENTARQVRFSLAGFSRAYDWCRSHRR